MVTRSALFLVLAGVSACLSAQTQLPPPDKLCSALTSVDLRTEGWKPSKAIPGEWMCMTPLVPFGAASKAGLQNNIAYYVSGSSASQLTDVRLKININNPAERFQAQWRLETATATLFQTIGQQVPADLRRGLANLAPISAEASFGRVELAADPGRVESFKVIITPGATVRASQELKASSSNDYERCVAAVAQAAGYPASNLAGDGTPTQESGYKSFLIKGRNRDLFFCEVDPSERSKVKAALGGQFPFRYIAEGRL